MATCDHCGFQSNVTKMFDHHMVSVHPDAIQIDPENDQLIQIRTAKVKNEEVHGDNFDISDFKCKKFESKPDFGEIFQSNFKSNEKIRRNVANLVKKVKCASCDFVCDYESSLRKHKSHGCFRWKCAACSFKTSLRASFIDHQPGKCKMDGNPNNKGHAICDMCDYQANTFGQLRSHKERNRCFKYTCKYCPFKTSIRKNFTFHRVHKLCLRKTRPGQVKFKITNGGVKGKYSCKFCDYKGNSFANLQFHQTRPCFRHNCQHCDFKTSVLNNLKDHEEKTNHFRNREILPAVKKEAGVITGGLFVCKKCDYKGTGIQNFNHHKRMKSCYTFACLVCNFKTSMIKKFGDHKRKMGKKHIYRKWKENMRLAIQKYTKEKVKIEKTSIDFICGGCDYKGKSMPKLEFHKNLGCFRYKCAECDFKTSLKLTIVSHKELNKHKKFKLKLKQASKLECAKCDFKTLMTHNLKKHMQNSKGCFRFKCDLSCDFKTSMLSEIRKHRAEHGLGEGKTKGEFPCSKCDYKAKFLGVYMKHKICFRFTCNVCDFKSAYRQRLKAHRLNAGHERAKQRKKIKFVCEKCDFGSANLKALRKHIKNQCYNFKCPMTHCVFKSSSRLSLQHHESKCFKEENNFGCSKCDFKADQKNKENQRVGLIKHKRLGCFALTCTKCEFKTSNTKDFQTHKEGHRVTSYACNKCDYTAKAKTEREYRVLMERHVTLGCFRF